MEDGSETRLLGRLSAPSKAKARSDWGSDRALSAESPGGWVCGVASEKTLPFFLCWDNPQLDRRNATARSRPSYGLVADAHLFRDLPV